MHPASEATLNQRNGVNAVDISRTIDARTARIALSLIRRPIKSRRYPAKQERLVTPQEAARLVR